MQHIPLFKEKRMMLKLRNISYERESGKFNFKVFLTVDVSISEVHLRQQARRRLIWLGRGITLMPPSEENGN